VKIVCSQEEEPLGTAGPIKLAKELLLAPMVNESGEKVVDECPYFFVFNSDIICEFPLQTLIDFHKSHGKEATMMVTQVEDPSKYGVVVMAPTQSTEEGGRVARFVEKPKEFLTNRVNAGLYIFNKSVLDRIDVKPGFLERDVFPRQAEEG
jgi:mannose-1-phosphate guanylyltransferase